jgi:hypothetical protein
LFIGRLYDSRDQQVEHNPKTMIETFFPRRLTICLSPQSHTKKQHPSPRQIGSSDTPAEPLVCVRSGMQRSFFYLSLRPWNSSLSAKSVVYQQFCKRQEGRGTQKTCVAHALHVRFILLSGQLRRLVSVRTHRIKMRRCYRPLFLLSFCQQFLWRFPIPRHFAVLLLFLSPWARRSNL